MNKLMRSAVLAGDIQKFSAGGDAGMTATGHLAKGGEIIPFIASTSNSDTDADVINQNWDLATYKDNPVILWNHSVFHPIGRGVRAFTSGATGNLQIDVQFDDSDNNPLGKQIAHQYREKFLRGGSVGFRPGSVVKRTSLGEDHEAFLTREGADDVSPWGGNFIDSPKLFEFSAATIPANSDALSRLSIGDEIRDWAMTSGDFATAFKLWLTETNGTELLEFTRRALLADEEFRKVLALDLFIGGSSAAESTGLDNPQNVDAVKTLLDNIASIFKE